MSTVAVLGAGPAGLMAALTAARAGHHCVVFEAADHVGGMAASVTVAGQRVDLGSHRLHPAADPRVLELLGGLLGADLQTRPRNGRIRLRDRWVAFPLRTGDMIRNLPPSFALRAGRDAVVGAIRPRSGDGTFAGEVTARLGPTVATEFYGPYARKLYGTDPADLDAQVARRRVSASSAGDVARRVLRATRASGRTFLYPRRGFGQIVEALADAAVAAGAEIRLSSPVRRIRHGRSSVTVGTDEADLDAAVALSTLPVGTSLAALDPAPPPGVVTAASSLGTRAMVVVHLVVDRARWTPFDAHYLPDPGLSVARLSEPRNYRDGDDPPDRTVVCAEIPCRPGDELWTMPDEDLGALVVDEIASLGLPVPEPAAAEARRLASVYPVYERATMADRRLVDRHLAGLDRVLTLGRQGLSVFDNTHHVLAMGAAAAGVLDASGAPDREAWRRELARFETNIVED